MPLSHFSAPAAYNPGFTTKLTFSRLGLSEGNSQVTAMSALGQQAVVGPNRLSARSTQTSVWWLPRGYCSAFIPKPLLGANLIFLIISM